MPRTILDHQLTMLKERVLELGHGVGSALSEGLEALDQPLQPGAEGGPAVTETALRQQARAIAQQGECVIALQQPVGPDLRAVLAALTVAEELGRMGEHAIGIMRLSERLHALSPTPQTLGLQALGVRTRVQVQDALDAYRRGDVAQARAIWRADAGVDALYTHVADQLMGDLIKGTEEALHVTYLLWVAHGLERIADRAGQICEQVVYAGTGGREISQAS